MLTYMDMLPCREFTSFWTSLYTRKILQYGVLAAICLNKQVYSLCWTNALVPWTHSYLDCECHVTYHSGASGKWHHVNPDWYHRNVNSYYSEKGCHNLLTKKYMNSVSVQYNLLFKNDHQWTMDKDAFFHENYVVATTAIIGWLDLHNRPNLYPLVFM